MRPRDDRGLTVWVWLWQSIWYLITERSTWCEEEDNSTEGLFKGRMEYGIVRMFFSHLLYELIKSKFIIKISLFQMKNNQKPKMNLENPFKIFSLPVEWQKRQKKYTGQVNTIFTNWFDGTSNLSLKPSKKKVKITLYYNQT